MTVAAKVPEGAIEIVPDDDELQPARINAIRCNGDAGNVHFVDGLGNEHTWPIAAGETIAIEVVQVFASDTTATLLAGLL